jgi:hypothetical protein
MFHWANSLSSLVVLVLRLHVSSFSKLVVLLALRSKCLLCPPCHLTPHPHKPGPCPIEGEGKREEACMFHWANSLSSLVVLLVLRFHVSRFSNLVVLIVHVRDLGVSGCLIFKAFTSPSANTNTP